MPVRDHLLQIQRGLYDRFRSNARQSVGHPSPALRRYFLEYQREFADYTGVSSRSELVRAMLRSDILICGDYHTLPQAQRTALRLMTECVTALRHRGRPLVLALEMLRETDSRATEKYLAGEWDEARYLAAIGYARNWGFAWENYRPLFEFARAHGVQVLPLNAPREGKKPTLQQRDRFAARKLAEYSAAHPRDCVLALIGDLHLAQGHLPAALERELDGRGKTRRCTVVHQNAEKLYWKLAARGLEHRVGVVKVKKDVYCVMNTPPWVKLQSYLRWVEGDTEPEELPEGDWDKAVYTEDFLDLARTIARFVGVKQLPVAPFEITWRHETASLRALGGTPFQTRFRRLILKNVGSTFLPGDNRVLLPGPHINAAATQAAVYLHACSSGRWKTFEFPRQDFYPTVWIEALGFLGSKVINPHRRCYGPRDFEDAAKTDGFARRVHAHLSEERGARFAGVALPARVTTPERALLFYRQARCLGQILGDALYAAVVSNEVRSEELRALFADPFSDGKKARALYLKWARRLDAKGLRDAIHRDRW